MVFKEEGQTSNITPASKSRYHLQLCDGLYIYDLIAIKNVKNKLIYRKVYGFLTTLQLFFNLFFLSFFSWQNICCGWALMRIL